MWVFPINGLSALIRFLVRVIPKTSRAAYPCQRAAVPLASGFLIWLSGTVGSVAAIDSVAVDSLRCEQTKAVSFSTRNIIDGSFDGAHSVYATDVDGDGDLDVLGAAVEDDAIAWWENLNSNGTTWTRHIVDNSFDGAVTVYAEDVDGDNDIDILGACVYDHDITWWENVNGDGLTWAERTIDGSFERASYVYAADIDGDDDIDVLGSAGTDDDITWWENVFGGGLIWVEHTIDSFFDGAWGVYAADVDGDNDLDVLGAAHYADDITWWENVNGNGLTWTEHIVDGDFAWAHGVYAADVDGDDDIDILGASVDDKEVTWWENINGDGLTWSEHIVDNNADGAVIIYTADIDADGDLDILGAVYYNNDIIWWENIGGRGTAWERHIIDADFGNAHCVYADDLDGDGDLDILGAAFGADQIAWWQNQSSISINGDFEPDGDVDYDDLNFMAARWLDTGVPYYRDYFARGFQQGVVADMNIPRTKVPPMVDGRLTQGEWQGAFVFEVDFPDARTSPKQGACWVNTLGRDPTSSELSTSWYFMWDVNNLYVAVSANDNSPYHDSADNGPYYAKDVAQLTFSLFDCGDGTWQPSGPSGTCAALYDIVPDTISGTGPHFSQYNCDYVNPYRTDSDIPGAEIKGKWWADGWVVEISIPWSEVDFYGHDYVPSVGDTHGINLLYINRDSGGLTIATYALGGALPWDSMSDWPNIKLVESNSQSASWPWHNGILMYEPLDSPADLYKEAYPNDVINFKDLAILADNLDK